MIGKIPNIDDELLLMSVLEGIETYIVAHFFTIFRAESDWQSIKIPQHFPFQLVNERFKEKITTNDYYNKKDEVTVENIYKLLKTTIQLSKRTNEGKSIKFNGLFFQDREESSICHISDLYQNQFPTNLCQSEKSIFSIDSNGNVFAYDICNTKSTPIDFHIAKHRWPYKFINIIENICEFSEQNQGESIIGISLEGDGTIFTLFSSGIVFYYKNDQWHFNIDKAILKKSGIVEPSDKIQTIYDSIIGHHGCCIGILPENSPLFPTEDDDDIFQKLGILGKKFHEIPPEIRAEIVSIDGATLIERDSNIIRGVAQILPVKSSKNEGARTGAAKCIANNGGVGIKVSEDGYVDVYAKDKKEHIQCILSFGKGISRVGRVQCH